MLEPDYTPEHQAPSEDVCLDRGGEAVFVTVGLGAGACQRVALTNLGAHTLTEARLSAFRFYVQKFSETAALQAAEIRSRHKLALGWTRA